jgi:prepilin-type N-terminal cleavage/methylation domain-containing protein
MKFSHKKTKNFNIFRRGKGFSLVEMSVVILIIGMLIAGISQGVDLYSDFKLKTAQNLTINSRVSRIEDLALWLETTLEKSFQTKMVNNSAVLQWNNISPFALDNKNALSCTINYPTYFENNINGLPAIQFKKSSQNCMSVESGFDKNTENVTIFVALIANSINNQGRIIEKWSDGSNSYPYPYVLRQNFFFAAYSGNINNFPNTEFTGKINTPNIISARRIKSGKLSIWLNGAKANETDDTITTNSTNDHPLYIGGMSNWGDFNVGEIIIYSRALSDVELLAVNKYLSQKWNIKF